MSKKLKDTPTTPTAPTADQMLNPFGAGSDGADGNPNSPASPEAKVGLFMRRAPEEAENLVVPATRARTGVLAALLPNGKWSSSVVHYFPAWFDKRARKWSWPSLRTIRAFVFECEECGTVRTTGGEVTQFAKANGFHAQTGNGKRPNDIDWVLSLGGVCPKCGKLTAKTWRQFNPLGLDGVQVYGQPTVDWFKSQIETATGDLELPPVIFYAENGVAGDDSRAPSVLRDLVDKVIAVAGDHGLQVCSLESLNKGDQVGGIDVVLPEVMTGTCLASDLDVGVKSPDGDRFRIDLRINMRDALNGRDPFIPTSDCSFPGQHKAKANSRPKGGWHF